MVSVFAIFASLSLLEMKQIGVGLAVAVLVDATLVRVVMLPSMLVLLGPGRLVAAPADAARAHAGHRAERAPELVGSA